MTQSTSKNQKYFRLFFVAIAAGAVGGAVVWMTQGHTFRLMPSEMSYADLVAVLLTAVSLMVGIFGVVLAVLAIWGYSHFKNVVQDASRISAREVAEVTARDHVTEDLSNGSTRTLIENLVVKFLEDAERGGAYKAWQEERKVQEKNLQDLDKENGEEENHAAK